MLDHVEHHPGLVAPDVAFVDEQPLGDFAVMGDAAGDQQHQVVPFAGNRIALLHFRRGAHARTERGMQPQRIALHGHQHGGERRARERTRIKHRDLAQQSVPPIACDPPLHGAGRETHGVAECGQRDRRIALQQRQQPVVEGVERERGTGHAKILRPRARMINRSPHARPSLCAPRRTMRATTPHGARP
jgi:hypothetical protein